MPTFVVYINGKKTKFTHRGANKEGLKKFLESVSNFTSMKQKIENQKLGNGQKSEVNENKEKDVDSSLTKTFVHNNFVEEENLNKKNPKKNFCCLIS
jgi:hypothetical protein